MDPKPLRPRSLRFEADTPSHSVTPSPASENEHVHFFDDSLEYSEVSEFMKEIDEILDYMKPFPRRVQPEKEVDDLGCASASTTPTNRVDHLENLIRLVEQLKELKERNFEAREKFKEARNQRGRKAKFTYDFDIPPPPPDPLAKRSLLPFRRNSRANSITGVQDVLPTCSRRKSLAQGKSKISKWTKVKEAFRWEKASQLEGKPRKYDKRDVPTEVASQQTSCEANQSNLLKVPERPSGTPSPADSVLSGHLSIGSSSGATSSSCLLTTSGYSGEPSYGTLSHSSVCLGEWAHHTSRHASLPEPHTQSMQELSSSSGDEKAEENLTGRKDLIKGRLSEESDARRSKSLDGETILGPSPHLFHEFNDESKSKVKTPWEKVIDIIQTRKDSLKKKKRDEDGNSSHLQTADDPATPEGAKEHVGAAAPTIELTLEGETEPSSHILTRRLQNSQIRPLTPVLTITTPSTEELRSISTLTTNEVTTVPDAKEHGESCLESDTVLTFPAPACNSSAVPIPGRNSRWVRVKKAFLTSTSPEVVSSAPSSPLQLGAFFFDQESADELSSGDWTENKRESFQYPVYSEDPLDFRSGHPAQEREPNERRITISKFPPDTEKCDDILKKPRESLSIPLPTVNDLSPEFKKKLDEWKKIKKTPTTPPTSKDDTQGHFISRIGEWQRWRPGSSGKSESHHIKHEHHLQDEFYKRLEEWQMLKSSKRSRSHSDKGKTNRETPSPSISRKNSKRKKLTSGKSSGTDSQGGSIKEKEGRAGRKTQKEKDLQWLEKELQKIEREKLRLEREKEKYLEREARLEQMKRTMGTTTPTQEVLIQTATGFFRFEGISQKFALKLYEWEKSRGIAPEASTLALLEKASVPCRVREDRPGLQRSKSVGSVIDTSSAAALSNAHHPSSLSLNDADDFEAMEHASILADAVRMSEDYGSKEDEEPEALIVDVEDIVEETAEVLEYEPQVRVEVPVYSYAPAEVTQLIDSSGSDCEPELHICHTVNTADVTLIEENISLLDKLEKNENICRKIEKDMDVIDGKFTDGSTFSEENQNRLRLEGENLHHSFIDHSQRRKDIANSLVDKMRNLHEATSRTLKVDAKGDINAIIDITTQLLALTEKLATDLMEQNPKQSTKWREKGRINRLGADKIWFSIEEENLPQVEKSNPSNLDIGDLSSIITSKVMELKMGLQLLRQASVDKGEPCPSEPEGNCTSALSTTSAPIETPPSSSSPLQKSPIRKKRSNDLGKSKAQLICCEDAEEIYKRSLKVTEQVRDQKSPEVLKKRIKDNIQKMQRLATQPQSRSRVDEPEKSEEVIDDNKIFTVDREVKSHKNNLKARRITDTSIVYQAKSGVSNYPQLEELSGTTPNIVFVPTCRKIISPIQTDSPTSALKYVIDDIESPTAATPKSISDDLTKPLKSVDIGTPPIASSPIAIRKFDSKDAAPSIRMMIAKYNKKINETQECDDNRVAQPAWRSPVLDRKIKEQMAKFENDGANILRHGGKFGRGEIAKSASTGLLKNTAVSEAMNICLAKACDKGILKSSSTGTVKSAIRGSSSAIPSPQLPTTKKYEEIQVYPLALRALRIRQAKADFLARGPSSQSYSGDANNAHTPTSTCSAFSWSEKQDSAVEEMKSRNRLSHASVGSENSFDDVSFDERLPVLTKSASAGMLNPVRESVISAAQRTIQKTVSTSAVPLPTPESPTKVKKFGIFNIKSKFRKVKMRKAKEKEKESAVQTLVRQSLVLGVSRSSSEPDVPAPVASCSRSCPASPVLERSRPTAEGPKWALSRARLFHGKETKRHSTESTCEAHDVR